MQGPGGATHELADGDVPTLFAALVLQESQLRVGGDGACPDAFWDRPLINDIGRSLSERFDGVDVVPTKTLLQLLMGHAIKGGQGGLLPNRLVCQMIVDEILAHWPKRRGFDDLRLDQLDDIGQPLAFELDASPQQTTPGRQLLHIFKGLIHARGHAIGGASPTPPWLCRYR